MNCNDNEKQSGDAPENPIAVKNQAQNKKRFPAEVGGPKGPEPTRYGDWEIGGKCVDF